MNAKVVEAINQQINSELSASYSYLAMSAYCERQKFTGAARWLRLQSQEEHMHAMKLFDFILARDHSVELQAINRPAPGLRLARRRLPSARSSRSRKSAARLTRSTRPRSPRRPSPPSPSCSGSSPSRSRKRRRRARSSRSSTSSETTPRRSSTWIASSAPDRGRSGRRRRVTARGRTVQP